MPMPDDQGQFGTCCGHAFSKAIVQGTLAKYGVALEQTAFTSQVKTLCPCFDGYDPILMCEHWNAALESNNGVWTEAMGGRQRYRVKVNFRKLDNIDDTHAELKKWQPTLVFVGVISTDEDGHSLHAVALHQAFDEAPCMAATNSWGNNRAIIDVAQHNFKYGVFLEPEIIACDDKTTRPNPDNTMIPHTTRSYKESKRRPKNDKRLDTLPDTLKREMSALRKQLHQVSLRGIVKRMSERITGRGSNADTPLKSRLFSSALALTELPLIVTLSCAAADEPTAVGPLNRLQGEAAKYLGIYVLDPARVVNGYPAWRQMASDDTTVRWIARSVDGLWHGQPSKDLGASCGFIALHDSSCAYPCDSAVAWEAHDGRAWQSILQMECVKRPPIPDAIQIQLEVGARGAVLQGEAAKYLGIYVLDPTRVVNGYPAWRQMASDDTTVRWIARSVDGLWHGQPSTDLGARCGFINLRDSSCAYPCDDSTVAWEAHDGKAWQTLPDMKCLGFAGLMNTISTA